MLVSSLAFGCAGEMNHRTVASTSTIHSAEAAGAADNPQAAIYLKLARDDLADAVYYGTDSDRGNRALERANADAELALSLATAANQRAEAMAQKQKVEQLTAACATGTETE
jgi:hypothetical protein